MNPCRCPRNDVTADNEKNIDADKSEQFIDRLSKAYRYMLENRRTRAALNEAAAQAKVATQMGTQIHGMPNYRRVVELIQSGAIGKVSEVHVCVSRAWGLQSKADLRAV